METIFLLRHGETAWNKERRIMGRREVPLSQKGIVQAKRIARIIPRLRIDAIYTSPLKRSLQTSSILAEAGDLPIKIDDGLIELAYGRWEGCEFKQIIRERTYHRFLKDPLNTSVPGGETLRDVQKRGLKALRRAVKERPQGRLLFVSHGDVLRAIICHYLKLPLEEFRRLRIDNGSLTAFETHGPWAEIKFINYLPDITQASRKPDEGLSLTLLKKEING